jgi:large subunit ribosomal protein L10
LKSKVKKKDEIAELHHAFQESTGIIVAGYKGMNVSEMNEFRVSLRENKLRFKVVKNTLAKRASTNTPVAEALDMFTGMVGVALGKDDPVILAKKILEFAKNNEKLVISGGIIEGKRYSVADLKTVSDLPSKDVLLAMMLGIIQSPLSTFASLLHSTIRQFLYALEGLKSKKI